MSTIGDRMRWAPGDPSRDLELTDVLLALGVLDRPEVEQREAVQRALSAGDLGAPSLAALSAAGWLAASEPAGSGEPLDTEFADLDEQLAALEAALAARRDRAWRWAVAYRIGTSVALLASMVVLLAHETLPPVPVLLLPGSLVLAFLLADISFKMGKFDAAMEEYLRERRELNRLRAARDGGSDARAALERLREQVASVAPAERAAVGRRPKRL